LSEIDQCELCDELTGGVRGHALWPKLAGWNAGSRVVAENDSYVSLVTVGPIARGHCLVVPRRHRLSMSVQSLCDRRMLADFCDRLVARMQAIYERPVLLFEHGAPEGTDARPCTVSHAHWHFVPIAIKPEELLLAEYEWVERENPWVQSDCEYLLVGDTRGRFWATYPKSRIPSQSLRRALAERTGNSLHWDWRSVPATELALATLRDFREAD
jgi:diadenosine tetraphosphate (Ap4A) HIT family hydrolase